MKLYLKTYFLLLLAFLLFSTCKKRKCKSESDTTFDNPLISIVENCQPKHDTYAYTGISLVNDSVTFYNDFNTQGIESIDFKNNSIIYVYAKIKMCEIYQVHFKIEETDSDWLLKIECCGKKNCLVGKPARSIESAIKANKLNNKSIRYEIIYK